MGLVRLRNPWGERQRLAAAREAGADARLYSARTLTVPEPGVAQHHGQGQGEARAGDQGPGRVLVRDIQY